MAVFRLYYINSADGVDLSPEWDFKEDSFKIESRHRTRDGSEFIYKWGSVTSAKMKVSFVDSSFKAVVNSWWESNADLSFAGIGESDVTSVHLTNKQIPVGGYVKPYLDLFKGKIELGTY